MINAETVFTELAKELRKFVPGAVFGGTYDIVSDAIETALATARQADAPAPATCTMCKEIEQWRQSHTRLKNDFDALRTERDTALARVKELEGKAATGAVRVFVSDAGNYWAWRNGQCFRSNSRKEWTRKTLVEVFYHNNADEYATALSHETELTPAEVAALLAKSPLPAEVKP